ncbi:hypothetical protein RHS03_07922, partial [Rhizoctonia solani]
MENEAMHFPALTRRPATNGARSEKDQAPSTPKVTSTAGSTGSASTTSASRTQRSGPHKAPSRSGTIDSAVPPTATVKQPAQTSVAPAPATSSAPSVPIQQTLVAERDAFIQQNSQIESLQAKIKQQEKTIQQKDVEIKQKDAEIKQRGEEAKQARALYEHFKNKSENLESQPYRQEVVSIRRHLQVDELCEPWEINKRFGEIVRKVEDISRDIGESLGQLPAVPNLTTLDLLRLLSKAPESQPLAAAEPSIELDTEDFIDFGCRALINQTLFDGILSHSVFHPGLNPGENQFYRDLYKRVRDEESQVLAGRWRISTLKFINASYPYAPKDEALHLWRDTLLPFCSNIINQELCFEPIQSLAPELQNLFERAWEWNRLTRNSVIMLDFHPYFQPPGAAYDPQYSTLEGRRPKHPASNAILLTSKLGLLSSYSDGKGKDLQYTAQTKATMHTPPFLHDPDQKFTDSDRLALLVFRYGSILIVMSTALEPGIKVGDRDACKTAPIKSQCRLSKESKDGSNSGSGKKRTGGAHAVRGEPILLVMDATERDRYWEHRSERADRQLSGLNHELEASKKRLKELEAIQSQVSPRDQPHVQREIERTQREIRRSIDASALLRTHLQVYDDKEPGEITSAFRSINRAIDNLCRDMVEDMAKLRPDNKGPPVKTSLNVRDMLVVRQILYPQGLTNPSLIESSSVGRPIEEFVEFALRFLINRDIDYHIFQPFHPLLKPEVNTYVMELYEGVRLRDPQVISGRWRVSTFEAHQATHTQSNVQNWLDNYVSQLIHYLLQPFLVAVYGDSARMTTKHKEAVTSAVNKAYQWNQMVKTQVILLDFHPTMFQTGAPYNLKAMKLLERVPAPAVGEPILATMGLGLESSEAEGGGRPPKYVWQEQALILSNEYFET